MRIYFDTEFSSLWDPQLLSVGMAADDGTTLYLEVEHDPARHSAFTRDVVVPLMKDCALSRPRAAEMIRDYLREFVKPELVCDFIGDWWLLRELVPDIADIGTPRCALDHPRHQWPNQHNALADAKELRKFNPKLQPGTD